MNETMTNFANNNNDLLQRLIDAEVALQVKIILKISINLLIIQSCLRL